MSDDHIVINIITPSGIVYQHRGKSVEARATDGFFGILPNHLPIIATLTISEVRVVRADKEHHEDAIAVNGGYLEFSNNTANIIADSAERARDIDLRRAQYAKERAQESLEQAEAVKDVDEVKRAQISLARAINRINVSNHR